MKSTEEKASIPFIELAIYVISAYKLVLLYLTFYLKFLFMQKI